MKKDTNLLKSLNWIIFFTLAVVLCISIFRQTLTPHSGMAFYQRNIKNIDSGWTVSTENKKIGDDQSIPQDYSTGTDKYLTLTRNLPGNVEDSDYLLILTNYQKVNVTINGQNIYTYNGVYGFLSDYSPNKEYLLVPMKGIYSNQPISITYNAAMHRYTGRIGTVSLGNKSDLIFQLIFKK